jgi:hypothetical protein
MNLRRLGRVDRAPHGSDEKPVLDPDEEANTLHVRTQGFPQRDVVHPVHAGPLS